MNTINNIHRYCVIILLLLGWASLKGQEQTIFFMVVEQTDGSELYFSISENYPLLRYHYGGEDGVNELVIQSASGTIEVPCPNIKRLFTRTTQGESVVNKVEPVDVDGQPLYVPSEKVSEAIKATFNADIALPAEANGRIEVTDKGGLKFSKGEDVIMALLDMKQGDVVKFVFTGRLFGDSSKLRLKSASTRGTRAAGDMELVSEAEYEVIEAGDQVVTVKLDELEATVGTISVTEPVQSITLKNSKLAYCSDKNLDFSGREDVKAFVVSGYDYQGETSTIYLTRVKDVPAGTPIIVKGTAGTTYKIPIKASSSSYYENMLKGNITGGAITLNPTEGDYMNMVMSGGQFWAFNSPVSFPANMSYLQLPKPEAMPSATPGSSQIVKINNDKGKVTLCSTVDLDFSSLEGDGVKAFTVTGYDNSSSVIWLTRVTRVSAGVGLIVKGPKGEYSVPSSGAQTCYANMLVGNNSGSSVSLDPSDEIYTHMVMSKGEFLSFGSTIDFPSGMAYLRIPKAALAMTRSSKDDTPSSSYCFTDEPEVISMTIDTRSIGGEGDTTGIHETKREGVRSEEWYTLQGQRVAKPGKGIYIHNGKKVVIK